MVKITEKLVFSNMARNILPPPMSIVISEYTLVQWSSINKVKKLNSDEYIENVCMLKRLTRCRWQKLRSSK